MKSKSFIGRFVLIFLLAAAFFIVSCSSSDEKDNKVGFGSGSDEDTDDDADTANDNDPADSASDEDTDSDSANNDDGDTSDSDTADGDTDTSDETDTDFEKEAEGCTMIEVPQITMGGAYADEINGYLSPAIGGNAIDIIKILLMGDIKEGTYELGTGINETYMNCKQCVMVWVDAELGAAQEYYFQTSGTLTITEVKDVDGINRTTGRIKNLILKQAETDEHLSDFTIIPEGKCIAAEIVEWDTTNTPNNSGD